MAFKPFFDVPVDTLTKPKKKHKPTDDERGCKFCPLNKVEGIQKIKGTIRGKRVLVVAQSPGPNENDEGIELIGPAGEWWWDELSEVGVTRDDVDCLNAVKCFPADLVEGTYDSYLKMRSPTKEEIHCCSLYTDRAMEQSKASQILVLGQIAAKALLETRSLPKHKIFWSDKFQARIYLLDHPAFFIRGYGAGPRYTAFKKILRQFADDRKSLSKGRKNLEGGVEDLSDQYAYIRKQDYRLVTTTKQAKEADRIIRKYAAKGKRISVDIEDDRWEREEKRSIIAIGFSPKPGLSFTFVFRHDEVPAKHLIEVRAIAVRILQDEAVKKVMHYGCSDWNKLAELEDIIVAGYTHDTNLSEYLRFSDQKSYGLDAITERRFPQFSGYKLLPVPEMMAAAEQVWLKEHPEKKKSPAVFRATLQAQLTYLERNKGYHLRHVSLETLRLYNGGDCDITKRLEVDNRKHVPQALMSLYIDLSFVLYDMEPNGPQFDYEQFEKLAFVYPSKEDKEVYRRSRLWRLEHRLRQIAGDKKFKPGSPQQVAKVMYEDLELVYPFEDKPNTKKMAMLMLGREHEFPRLMLEWRSDSKVGSTLKSYERSAKANNDRLRTRWWATGARTGRLSSGGEKQKKESTLINLQNIKKDPQMQNMCVADREWKRVYKFIAKLLKPETELKAYWAACDKSKKEKKLKPKPSPGIETKLAYLAKKIEKWIRKNMPDLKTYLILDYGQVEVRVAAQMANDKNLIKDCEESDIHTRVGVTMTGWDPDRIANDIVTRTLTKNVHFGILFGISKKNLFKFVLAMSPADMRDRLSQDEVDAAYDRYFARYQGIGRFIISQREFAREHSYVETLFGMKQTLTITDDGDHDEYIDPEEVEEGHAYWGNQAINGPVQGTAHQLMVCALVNLKRKKKKYEILGVPPLEVHDALYFGVRVLDLSECITKSKYLLEKESLNTVASDFPHIDWKVPIAVDTEAGLRLGDKVEVDAETPVGVFMLSWYRKARANQIALNKELEKVAA